MLRKAVFASITSLLVLAACGDDSGDSDDTDALAGASGMRAGSGGARAGTAGAPKGGTAPMGGGQSAGNPAGGAASGSAGMGEAGMPAVEGGAGGEPPVAAGSGGMGEAGTPSVQGGAGGEVTETAGAGAGGLGGGMGGTDGTSGAGGEGGGEDGVGLVARFAFDENTGTTSADKAGKFGPATLSGATWTPGRDATSGVELAANEAHVVLPAGLLNGVDKATIATWINMTNYQPWSRIFDIPGTGFMYLTSDIHTAAGPQFTIHTGSAATEVNLNAPAKLPVNAWKHVAVTVDGLNYTMYVDGYPIARKQVISSDLARTPSEVEPTAVGWLGKSLFPADAYLKAKLDDFQIHDEVLSQSEIADLAWPDMDYTYLRFDETTGTAAADSSDRDFDGTLVNGATWTSGKLGGAVSLSGGAGNTAGAYVSLAPQVVADCTDVTIALWAQLNTVSNWSRLIDFGSAGNFMFMTPAADVAGVPHLRFTIFADPAGYDVVAPYPVGTILAGQWHHFAFTLTGETGRIYFDGALIGTNPAMTINPSELPVVGSSIAWLGRSGNPADPFIDGSIDDVRIACRAYTADEIRLLSR